MFAIIIQNSALYLLGFIFLISIAGILLVLYNQIFKPYIDLKVSEIETPPNTGDEFVFVMSELERFATYTVGANTGDIITKCAAISEGHLNFQFKKDPKHENYQISIKREGAVLIKPPRMNIFSKMPATEKIESHELIGKSAFFRISDKVTKDGRMIDYIEISLTAKFFFDKIGSERLKFIFVINKIHPGFNLKNKNSKDLFSFGKDPSIKETVEFDAVED